MKNTFQKNIGIVELTGHTEVLLHFCELLSTTFKLFVFCDQSTHKQLEPLIENHIHWTIKKKEASTTEFFNQHIDTFEKCDCLLFTTVFSSFLAYRKLALLVPSILIVHNAHTFTRPNSWLYFRRKQILRDLFRGLLILLRQEHRNRRKLINSVQLIAVPSTTVKSYLDDTINLNLENPVVAIPFVKVENRIRKYSPEAVINIFIPGVVSSENRNYQQVIDAMKLALPKFECKVELALLGGPKGKEGRSIIQQFRTLENSTLRIYTYDDFLDQSRYNELIQQADFIVLPAKRYTRFSIYKEKNGYSKILGTYHDLIRYQIPGLIADHYPVDEVVQPLTSTFTDAGDLAQQLVDWVNNRRFESRSVDQNQLNAKYGKSVLLQQFTEIVERITSSDD